MTESERLKLHIWSLHESRDGPDMAEFRRMIAGMVTADCTGLAQYAWLNYNQQAVLASPYQGLPPSRLSLLDSLGMSAGMAAARMP